jgi:hypothetical protein
LKQTAVQQEAAFARFNQVLASSDLTGSAMEGDFHIATVVDAAADVESRALVANLDLLTGKRLGTVPY